MKKHILILLATVLSLSAVSCMKEIARLEPYPRNVGEEYLEVVPDTSLTFQGRGGTLTLVVKASYDGTIEATADWVKLSAPEFPGDQRQFNVNVVTEANKSGNDRQCEIIVRTPNLSKKIAVFQPKYERPEFKTKISTADEFVAFIENAPYVEENELVTIEQTIDLKDVTLPEAEFFNGVLDGKGNVINNLTSDHPLFATLNEKGAVQNLTVGAGSRITAKAQEESNAETYTAPFVGKNYGKIEKCENYATIVIEGKRTAKDYVGGIVAYSYAGSSVKGCINRGEIQYHPESSSANVYAGGITGYSYGDIEENGNYGSITCDPAAFSAAYFVGGITPRHETGRLVGNITHKEVLISANEVFSGTEACYFGGIVGHTIGAPVTTANQCYCNIDIKTKNTKDNVYIGALQAFQAKVEGLPGGATEATLFEGSIVNSNIKAHYKSTNKYGNNPCTSAGFVTGRFSGQAASNPPTTLHYGTAENPIKVSGSVYCYASDTKVVTSSKDYQALLDGDNSATSVNGGEQPLADYNTIKYEVVGDGQTGPAEELILTIDGIKLEVPQTGGKTSFLFKANYDAVATAQAEWLFLDEAMTAKTMTFPVVDEKQTVTVYAKENPRTTDRSGKVSVELPNGTYGDVEILQAGNKTLSAELEVSETELEPLPEGSDVTFNVTANYDATVTTDVDWLTIDPATVVGDYKANPVKVTAKANDAADAQYREATVTVTVKELTKTVTIKQEKFEFVPKDEIGAVEDFLDFVKYAENPSLYPADKTIKLTADINLEGQTLKPISTFVATFDGDGHKLLNWDCDGPLFAKIASTATVKNLVIDGSCTANLRFENATLSGTNYCIGVICGDVDGGALIDNCINNAPVKLVTFGDANTFVGAIAGRTTGYDEKKSIIESLVKGCVNNGSVTVSPESVKSNQSYRVAGIVAGSNGNIEGCINEGAIELSPASFAGTKNNQFVGGVAAYLAKTNHQALTGSVNKGKVTFNPKDVANISQSYVGGLLAYLDGAINYGMEGYTAKFIDCKNFGDVLSTAAVENVAIGGLLGWANKGGEGNIFLQNSVVNCNVTANSASEGGAVNPCKSAGLVIGCVANNIICIVGGSTASESIKVAGSITMQGGSPVEAKEDNFKALTHGSKLVTKYEDPAANLAINAKYEVVTPPVK